MIFYVIVFLIIILNFLIKDRKLYCFLIGCILVLFAGLRADIIGPDTLNYKYIYEDIRRFGINNLGFFFLTESEQDAEPGFIVFQYLISRLGGYNLFKFLCAIIQVVPAVLLIYRYSTNKCFSFIIFFCLPVYLMMSMSMMRQGLAWGIFLLGFHYILERKFWKYTLTIAIAFMFHSTSLILLPLYFLYKIPYRRIYNWLVLAGVAIAYLFKGIIFSFFSGFTRMKYEADTAGGMATFLLFIVFYFFTYFVSEKELQKPFLKFQLYLLVFTIFCWTFGMSLPVAFRLAAYTEFFLCLFLPNLIGNVKGVVNRQILHITLTIICILYLSIVSLRVYEYSYYPYYFMWECI